MKKPDCAWSLKDLDLVPQNGVRVMSTFACGGGSSMGYKRAGCTVLAANDIDPEMAWHYRRNINPKHYFLCPIGELLSAELPVELFNLDILDGSPPCSTFSMSGSREKAWGKEKHFREGQAKQVLSDLFFDFLDLVGHLRPKVVIAENVKGMLIGNAKGYTKLVTNRLRELGYEPQLFLLNAADCGVPQRRERVFFCAVRADLKKPKLVLEPKHRWISAGEAIADLQQLTPEEVLDTAPIDTDRRFWPHTAPGQTYATACQKLRGKGSFFNHAKLHPHQPAPTLTASADGTNHWAEMRGMTLREFVRLGAFPDDYVFQSPKLGRYMIGMSVPPKMTEQVARAVCEQWLGVIYDDSQETGKKAIRAD